jgi:hypothetical protein
MVTKDIDRAAESGATNLDRSLETVSAEQGRIDAIDVIGRGDEYNAFALSGYRAIKLH